MLMQREGSPADAAPSCPLITKSRLRLHPPSDLSVPMQREGSPADAAPSCPLITKSRLRLHLPSDLSVGSPGNSAEASGSTLLAAPWGAQIDPLAQDIAAVLKRMGGSAHQRDVVQCIVAMKRQRGETVAQDMARTIVEVFERYRDLFFKPFGEGSMRWALQPGVA
ncbi:MAG: hypothetical protein ACOVQF_01450 [Brevundimonas sp.]|jgi:hypothetical protein